MNEVIKSFIEKPKAAAISLALIGITAFSLIELYTKSENLLTNAKAFMADPVAQEQMCSPMELLPGRYFDDVCDVAKDVTLCDGNNTMLDFSDDICETLPEYTVYSRNFLALAEGLGR